MDVPRDEQNGCRRWYSIHRIEEAEEDRHKCGFDIFRLCNLLLIQMEAGSSNRMHERLEIFRGKTLRKNADSKDVLDDGHEIRHDRVH